ncbi:MauE/DoxX family redox-associated membrane protein [Microbacterium sp.]|uniref:peroxiredoxin family protein n=1 Tax=Microbacterium sp. TaxID=51671 RepID=UPI003341DC3E
MNIAVYALILVVLIGILGASGILKLLSPGSTIAGMRALGVPQLLRSPLFAIALPLAELCLGASLLALPRPFHEWALSVTAVLFGVFLVVVIRAVIARRSEPCHCFGAHDDAPISAATVVRNALLFGFALAAAVGPPRGPLLEVVGTGLEQDAGLFQLGLLILVSAGALHLRRSLTPSQPARQNPPSERTVSRHLLADLFGAEHDVRGFTADRRAVIVFVSTTCTACRALIPTLTQWLPTLREQGVHTWLVTDAPPAEAISAFPVFGAHLLHDRGNGLAREIGITSLPSAIYFGADGVPTVSLGPAEGIPAVEALIRNVLVAPAETGR